MNRIKQLALVWALILNNISFGQIFNAIPITFPDSNIFKIDINETEYKENLYNKYRKTFLFKNRLNDFIEISAEEKLKWNTSNFLYDIYYKENAYLKKIVDVCINENKSVKGNYKVNLIKDASINAFTMEDETIYTNIGLVAHLNNEAELAAVFAHEIGHVNEQHSQKRFKKYRNLIVWSIFFQLSRTYELGVKYLLIAKYFHHLRKQEKQSDNYTTNIFKQNHYSINAILEVEKTFTEFEKKEKNKLDYKKYSDLYRTHPKSFKRYKRLKKQVRHLKPEGRDNFLVDPVYFQKIKDLAVYESAFLNFRNSEYSACIEQCYYEYLNNKTNEFFKLMLYKAIHRKIQLNPSIINKNFITSNYKFYNKTIDECLNEVYGSKMKINDSNKKLQLITWKDAEIYFYNECLNGSKTLSLYVNAQTDSINKPIVQLSKFEGYLIHQMKAITPSEEKVRIPVICNRIYEKRMLGKTVLNNTAAGSEHYATISNFISNLNSEYKSKIDSIFRFIVKDSLNNYDQEMLQPKLDEISYKAINAQFDDATEKQIRRFIFRTKNQHKAVQVNLKEYFPDLYVYAANHHTNLMIIYDLILPYRNVISNNGGYKQYNFNINYLIIDFKNNIIQPKIYRSDFTFVNPAACSIIMDDFLNYLTKMVQEFRNNR